MNELTSYNSERIYWAVEQVEREAGDIDELHLDDNLFYLKSEADKVIAEKDKEIRRLRRALYKACANWAMSKSLLSYSKAVKFESYLPTKGAKLRRRSSLWHHCYEQCEAMAEEYK